jgi:hypothetical protein
MFARHVCSWPDRRARPGPAPISCCDLVGCTVCLSRHNSLTRAAKSSAARGLFTFLPLLGLVLSAARSPASRLRSEASGVNFPKQVSGRHRRGRWPTLSPARGRADISAARFAAFFADARVGPVLTAHPKEVRRKSTIDRKLEVAELLAAGRCRLTPIRRAAPSRLSDRRCRSLR